MRSHGKWGDFLVALIPLSWCGNILINSNFILRMLEWQNESSLFTVRIQGKQWYWSYKYNSDTNYRLNSVYINVGHNNWVKTSNQSNLIFNNNNSLLNFIYEYEFKKIHKQNLKKNEVDKLSLNSNNFLTNFNNYKIFNNNNIQTNLSFFKNYKKNLVQSYIKNILSKNVFYKKFLSNNFFSAQKNQLFSVKGNCYKMGYLENYKNLNRFRSSYLSKNKYHFKKFVNQYKTITNNFVYFNNLINLNQNFDFFNYNKLNNVGVVKLNNFMNDMNRGFYNLNTMTKKNKLVLRGIFRWELNSNLFLNYNQNSKFLDTDRLEEFFETSENLRVKDAKYPVRINKGILNKNNMNLLKKSSILNKNIMFNYKINKTDLSEKSSQPEQFWGFRQKRYKKMKSFAFLQTPKYDHLTYNYINNFLYEEKLNSYNMYTAVKNNKYKNELIPVTLARRLLRTKRTLMLPAHINLTLITNSYDVVHSWFVPGLGLKIDCVPGRSTHHSLYIDNVGFYYGQCAEICGRYHHHMPIRVCALPYEHFMLWWQTKGLPRIYRSDTLLKNKNILLHKFNYSVSG